MSLLCMEATPARDGDAVAIAQHGFGGLQVNECLRGCEEVVHGGRLKSSKDEYV